MVVVVVVSVVVLSSVIIRLPLLRTLRLVLLFDVEVAELCDRSDNDRSKLTPVVSQEFQIVGVTPTLWPSAFVVTSAPSASAIPWKEPSIITLLISAWVVSIQTSTSGVNSTFPCQNCTRYGVTFSTLVA